MVYTGPSYSLHVKITVAPENVPAFIEALKPAWDAVTSEPECIFFEVYQMDGEPGTFKFVENWNASKDWMVNVQMKKEYYKPYLEKTEPMWIKPREIEIYTRMEGNHWVLVKEELTQKP